MDLPPPMMKAIEFAKLSTHQHRLGAVITKGKRFLGGGYNQIRGHKYSKYYQYPQSCHAETAALLGQKHIRGSTMYVVRINNSGQLRNARPCASCLSLLKDFGIRKIIYTTFNSFNEERI